MNLVKNTMLAIILIQIMVMIELVAVKYWNIENTFNKVFQTLTLNKNTVSTPMLVMNVPSVEKNTPRIINVPLSKEKKAFVQSITLSLSEKMKMFSTYVGEQFLIAKSRIDVKKRKNLESQAKKFLGIRYVWGATGPNKFDCSGFTQKVYKIAGIKLPRHSTRQAMVGKYIKYKDLERGDMVFFDTSRKHKGVVNHVGIYLENGKFIHASSGKKKVVITSFKKKKFYKNRFLWGRRIIKEKRIQNISLNKKMMSLLSFATFKKQHKFPS